MTLSEKDIAYEKWLADDGTRHDKYTRLWNHTGPLKCEKDEKLVNGRVYKRTSKPYKRPKNEERSNAQIVVMETIEREWPHGCAVFMFSIADIMNLHDIDEWNELIPNNKDIRNTVVRTCSSFAKNGYLEVLAKQYPVPIDMKDKTKRQREQAARLELERMELRKKVAVNVLDDDGCACVVDVNIIPPYKPAPTKRQKRVITDDYDFWNDTSKAIGTFLKSNEPAKDIENFLAKIK